MKNLIIKFTMKTIKFKGKNTIFLNGMEYKGYNVGDLPPSFGFFKKHNGFDEDGNRWYGNILKYSYLSHPSHAFMLIDGKNWNDYGTAYPFLDSPGWAWEGMWGNLDPDTAAVGPEDYQPAFVDIDQFTGPRFRHLGDQKANVLITDGHVEGFKVTQIKGKNTANWD